MIEKVLIALMVIGVMVVGWGCQEVQKDNCRNNGGQPITRFFEYTGCIEGNGG